MIGRIKTADGVLFVMLVAGAIGLTLHFTISSSTVAQPSIYVHDDPDHKLEAELTGVFHIDNTQALFMYDTPSRHRCLVLKSHTQPPSMWCQELPFIEVTR